MSRIRIRYFLGVPKQARYFLGVLNQAMSKIADLIRKGDRCEVKREAIFKSDTLPCLLQRIPFQKGCRSLGQCWQK